MDIAQLRTLTSYSLLKSTNQINQLVLRAKELGYKSLAITDINTMHGIIEFYQICLKNGIKPIIGMTLTYTSEIVENKTFQLILLAKNNKGYQNLISISTCRMENEEKEAFYLNDINHLMENLYIISPWETKNSELRYLLEYDKSTFDEWFKKKRQCLTCGNFYQGVAIEKQNEESEEEIISIFRDNNISLISLEDVRYLYSDDYFCVEVLKHIDSGEKMAIDFTKIDGPHYFVEKDLIIDRLCKNHLKEALENNIKVASNCDVEIKLHQKLLPKYPLDKTGAKNSQTYLRDLCYEGLKKRGLDNERTYLDRINMELNVIDEMGFNDYFLIVWDVMKYARDHNIVTACRGSAAGSLVSYSLAITNVNPIEYHLLFERFLNSERYTMPDIDMDIPDNRREELLNYVHQKYGHQNVAQIATFGTLAAKMALRDVGRVFGLSQSELNIWANSVPNTLKITLEEAFKQSKKLQNLVSQSTKNEWLFETAKKIEGLPRHISTHAAGVVISDKPLTQYLPLQKGANDIPLTQLTMGDVEEIGLLKMDFLGLRNLSIIGNTLDSIKYTTGKTLELDDIPLNDNETLELFRRGQTVGVFQFESEGIKQVLRKLGPTSIEDIASVNALYRPGPMQNIDQFIARKKGQEDITYPHSNLKKILGYTYGVIVYQEQIMQIASLMAGFSLGQADILRRAISKKKKDVLETEKNHFIEGALKEGYNESVANEVYQYIEHFANYGFNRSHAVVYAVLAYQMAFLKRHYPENFFTSLLHSVKNNTNKLSEYLSEAKRFGINFLLPDVNRSEQSFKIYNKKIIFGLSSINGIRKDFSNEIISLRKKEGVFTSLENFLVRIHPKWLKEKYILPLIYAGAFDFLHSNRKQLIADLNNMINNIVYTGGNIDLLGVLSLKKEKIADFTVNEKLNQEHDYLGSYVSAHPVDMYNNLKKGRQIIKFADGKIDKTGSFLVFVLRTKNVRTKKGESMIILTVDDGTKELEVVVFPKLFRKISSSITENEVYLLSGKMTQNSFNQQSQILAENLVPAKDVVDFSKERKCYIRISDQKDQRVILNQIKKTLIRHRGTCPVVLVFDHKKVLLEENYWVAENSAFIKEMSQFLNKGMVIFQ